MIWLSILAATALILGGVLSVRPSKAQKRIASIRASAMQSGIHVKLPVSLKFPDDIEKGRLPFYCRHLREISFAGSYYCVLRDDDRISASSGDINVSLKTKIDAILMSADPDIRGFYLGDGLLGFSWLESERSEVLTGMGRCIDEVEALLQE